jgi:hypothetical protein
MPGTRVTWKVAGMHAQRPALGKIKSDHVASQLDPGPALAADALQHEALAGEDARSEGLLEARGDPDAGGACQKAAPVHQVLPAGSDLDRQDAAGKLRRERDSPRLAVRRVTAEQQRRSGDFAHQRAHHPLAAGAVSHAGGHLDRVGHPGELAGLGDDALAGVERDRQHGQRRAKQLVFHRLPSD